MMTHTRSVIGACPMPIHTDTEDNEEFSSSTVLDGNAQHLVPLKEDAYDMAHNVDSDGQVAVRSHATLREGCLTC